MALKAKFLLKFIGIVLLNLLVSCGRTVKQPQIESSTFGDKTRLTVALDIDMPGYITLEGEHFGYQYDLLKAYAEHNGMELNIVAGRTPSEFNNLLKVGEADIITAIPSNIEQDIHTVPLYSTSYVMLARTKDMAELKRSHVGNFDPAIITKDKRVMISSGFKATKTWDILLDSMRTESTYVSSRNCIELAEALKEGVYDFLICEKSEAQVGEAMVNGVLPVHEFEETIEIAMGISPAVSGLSKNFDEWFKGFRKSKEYSDLYSVYFERGNKSDVKDKKVKRSYGISEYDMIMRDVCEREGYDWRLMSAIAYNESRFKADVISNKGARGLMQIMPATARQFDIDPEDSMNPEINIMLAAKLLGKIEKALRLPKDITYIDRMSIILACYNCGVGHVTDARKLALKHDKNPNSWEDVSLFLELKAYPEYNGDEVVQCGTFKGSKQTLAFVSNVIGKYDMYCSTVNR